MSKTAIVLFHRDLRLTDNHVLHELQSFDKVYACFIFTPEQISHRNDYRSLNAIRFMLESLEELKETIYSKFNGELQFFYGKQIDVLNYLFAELKPNSLFFHADYTPFAIQRDNSTKELCNQLAIECHAIHDLYLQPPSSILGKNGKMYKKFTPFYESIITKPVDIPLRAIRIPFVKYPSTIRKYKTTLDEQMKSTGTSTIQNAVRGGRIEGLKLLQQAISEQKDYESTRDYMAKSTSKLSAHLKFGTLSIREVYHSFAKKYGKKCEFIRQLYWRDFFAHLLFAYPDGMDGSMSSLKKPQWNQSIRWWNAWITGNTGFPLVDAGIRELLNTGYMHNRARMVVATFFVKTLGLDWRKGEQFFAQHLTDYDVASNNGNWGNISSMGVYAQPYFRDMNPWIQSSKFDPDTEYIKKWVPELSSVESKIIHKWYKYADTNDYSNIYIKPIVVYEEQKKKVLELYR